MDPNELLNRIRYLASQLQRADDELALTFDQLDVWLSRGGFPPKEWTGQPFATGDDFAPSAATKLDHARDGYVLGTLACKRCDPGVGHNAPKQS